MWTPRLLPSTTQLQTRLEIWEVEVLGRVGGGRGGSAASLLKGLDLERIWPVAPGAGRGKFWLDGGWDQRWGSRGGASLGGVS